MLNPLFGATLYFLMAIHLKDKHKCNLALEIMVITFNLLLKAIFRPRTRFFITDP